MTPSSGREGLGSGAAAAMRSAEFLASVDACNGWRADRLVRNYQHEILESGALELVSPFSGDWVRAQGSRWIVPGLHIAYRFDFGRPAWVLSGELRFGYPLTALILQEGPPVALFSWSGERIGLATLGALSFAKLEDAWRRPVAAPDPRPAAVLGDPNFAHHIWNELAGLLDHIDRNGVGFPILSLFEPLGPLSGIFGVDVEPVNPYGPRLNRAGLITRVGSTLVTRAVQKRIVDYAASRVRPREAVRGRPTFWVSVRTTSRTCVNQIDFLSALTARLLKEFPDCRIFFDGFSYPEDIDDAARYQGLRGSFDRRAVESDAAVAEIMARLGASSRCVSISGARLSEAITIAAQVDYYFCHAGTIQHKVAWFHRIPGYIHSSRANLVAAALRWYVGQVEDGAPLDAIPAALVEDFPQEGTPDRNWSYRIIDVEAATQHAIDCARVALDARAE